MWTPEIELDPALQPSRDNPSIASKQTQTLKYDTEYDLKEGLLRGSAL
jgi:hypothetical protein